MARSAVLKIDIISDFNDKGFKQSESSLEKVGKQATVAAAAIGTGLVAASIKAVSAAEKGSSANAALANVLKQTADASAATVAGVQDYAQELAKLTGVDDDVIKGGQAILGTFKSVAASAGQSGGAFDRATQAALDLAAAGFGSVESNATSLGKALEDPIAGLSSLREQGVTFTAAEQDLIKAMVEAGDAAGAQALILSAIEGQVGGTAEATADASAKMKESWDEAWESLGTLLLPALDALAEKVQGASEWVQEHNGVVVAVAAALGALAATVLAVNAALKVYQAIQVAIRAATVVWTGVQWLLNVALTANPIGLIVLAIAALIAIIATVVYITRDKWLPVVKALWEWIKKAASAIWDSLGRAFDWLSGKISGAIDRVQSIIEWLRQLIAKAKSALSALNPFGGGIFGFGRTAAAGSGFPAARATAPGGAAPRQTVYVSSYSDPQAQARELARILTGARIRTGWTGIPA
jgi:hypothetical protein